MFQPTAGFKSHAEYRRAAQRARMNRLLRGLVASMNELAANARRCTAVFSALPVMMYRHQRDFNQALNDVQSIGKGKDTR